MKKVFVELEVLELPTNAILNDPKTYPHAGCFFVKFDDGVQAVIHVCNMTETSCCYECAYLPGTDVVDKEGYVTIDTMKAECEAVRKTYDDMKKDLEHDMDMEKLRLENEQPKRIAVGEWVSGKTLVDIIRTLTNKE